jgi:predicted ATPase
MITKWKLFNFKSFRKETNLALGPLTILAGANSSGKSTVLQSILIISQTLASKVSSRSVVLNGHLTKLGQFDDLRSYGGEANQIYIGWECESHIEGLDFNIPKSVACGVSFEVDPLAGRQDAAQLRPRLFSCELESVSLEAGVESASRLIVSRSVQPNKVQTLGIGELANINPAGLEYDVNLDENSLEEIGHKFSSAEPVGCNFRHFIPSSLVVRFDQVEREARRMATAIADPVFPPRARGVGERIIPQRIVELLKARLGDNAKLLFEAATENRPLLLRDNTTLRDWNNAFRRLPREKQMIIRQGLRGLRDELQPALSELLNQQMNQFAVAETELPSDLMDAVMYLDMFFSNYVRYLGPLRDEPKPLYPLATNADPLDVGLRGENTAAVFDLHKESFIRYIPTTSFPAIGSLAESVKRDFATRTLDSAVTDWLQYMGIAEKIRTEDKGKLGHQLQVVPQDIGMPHDLTHVGVGVSQVLPILVMCLLADPDTTVIIEQPELHLHPKVQTLLGDFFLSMAMLGKQCIVETHSEYIINRLRLRAASASGDEVSSLMKVYFVEKKEGASTFREVTVNRYGAVVEWPEGFFDQSQRESEEILRAGLAKKKQERQQKEERNA